MADIETTGSQPTDPTILVDTELEAYASSTAPPHRPTILWIGCSDARVIPESICPGQDIFTQRNIANQFHFLDDNALSCLAFTIASLPTITRIMVVGHTECAGVRACHRAASGNPLAPLDSTIWKWLGPLRILASSLWNQGRRTERELTDENVKVQVNNIRSALHWLPHLAQGRRLILSGYVYILGANPRLEQLVSDIPLHAMSSCEIAIEPGHMFDLKGNTHSAWDQEVEFVLKTGDTINERGHLYGRGYGDAMKFRGSTEITKRTFPSSTNARTLALTAKFKVPGQSNQGNSQTFLHTVTKTVGGTTEHISMLFTEDGGTGTHNIDYNDAMVNVRQYKG